MKFEFIRAIRAIHSYYYIAVTLTFPIFEKKVF